MSSRVNSSMVSARLSFVSAAVLICIRNPEQIPAMVDPQMPQQLLVSVLRRERK